MKKEINTENVPASLIPCVNLLSDYIGKIDRNGHEIFRNVIDDCDGPADLMSGLTNGLLSRFEYDVKEMNESRDPETLENLEDRENAITGTLSRAEFYGPEIYAETFRKTFNYSLKNIHPETAE